MFSIQIFICDPDFDMNIYSAVDPCCQQSNMHKDHLQVSQNTSVPEHILFSHEVCRYVYKVNRLYTIPLTICWTLHTALAGGGVGVDKVIAYMSTETRRWPPAITRLTAQIACGLIPAPGDCKQRTVIHDTKCPYWDKVTKLKLSDLVYSLQKWPPW